LIKVDEKLKEKLGNYYDEKLWTELLSIQATKNWQQSLPATNDYQTHSAEIKIDALPVGDYMLLAASGNFTKTAAIGARQFHVSNISYIDKGKEFFVLNRETGKPLAAATVQVWEQQYDPKQSKYIKQKTASYKTDANGYFKTKYSGENNYRNSYALDIIYNNDRLFMNDWMNDYYYYYEQLNNKEEPPIDKRRIFFFTDRSIYRPGQLVYFKGIAIIPDKEKTNKVLSDYSTWVYLRNANSETIDSIQVKTNEYGSFSGKFQLPSAGLNGEFSIYAKDDKGSAASPWKNINVPNSMLTMKK
jgi:uncharacterized protein YfaS (alpha-2-macroglobulin family)